MFPPRRAWLIPFGIIAIMLALRFHAKAADVCPVGRYPLTCGEVRACIEVAGGTEKAAEKARGLGFSEAAIARAKRICGIR